MQSLALDVNVVSEEGQRTEMRDEDDDLLRAAEELGIDLCGVRADDGSDAADEQAETDRRHRRRRRRRMPAEALEDADVDADADIDLGDVPAETNEA